MTEVVPVVEVIEEAGVEEEREGKAEEEITLRRQPFKTNSCTVTPEIMMMTEYRFLRKWLTQLLRSKYVLP